MRTLTALMMGLLSLASPARAHPVPKDNHDRTVVVRLTPEAVLVDYRLEVDELRAALDLRAMERPLPSSRVGLPAALADALAGPLAEALYARLDGRELTFRCVDKQTALLDHVRCDFRFRADWSLAPGKAHAFLFREGSYETDIISQQQVTLDGGPYLTLKNLEQADDALRRGDPERRTNADREKLRRVRATVLAVPSAEPGLAMPALPPDCHGKPGAVGRERARVGQGKPGGAISVARLRQGPPSAEGGRASGEKLADHGLLELLDSRKGLAMLLVLSAFFGAAHALTPGHGKALVAAYLVGQRGTAWHALGLGLITTLTHTGGVIVLAVMLAYFFPEMSPGAVQSALMIVGGLLIAGLGLWLLMQRLAGRADHVHLPGLSHSHGHGGEGELQPAGEPRAVWWQVVLLGIQGGIVPCWDACVMLLVCISTQRLWLGVPLLLAFSAGLAAVLVALGLMVVYAGEAARSRLGEDRVERLGRWLPRLSAVAILVLGLALAFSGMRAAS